MKVISYEHKPMSERFIAGEKYKLYELVMFIGS